MSEPARHEDLELLGLNAAAGPAEIARAYRELKDLYSDESLATYSLFSPEERSDLLRRLEVAHGRSGGRPADVPRAERAVSAAPPARPSVDPHQSPGAFLRACREALGRSVQDVAQETKISSRHLENIENENVEQLPVRVYLRGFLVAYAKALRLDSPRETAEQYLSKVEVDCAQVA